MTLDLNSVNIFYVTYFRPGSILVILALFISFNNHNILEISGHFYFKIIKPRPSISCCGSSEFKEKYVNIKKIKLYHRM